MAHVRQQAVVVARAEAGDMHPEHLPELFDALQRRAGGFGSGGYDAQSIGKEIGREKSTPRFSLPAIGWLPTNSTPWGRRDSADRTMERLVLPTSVTIAPGVSAGAIWPRICSNVPTGEQRTTRSDPATAAAGSSSAASMAPISRALSSDWRRWPYPTMRHAGAAKRSASPIEPPSRPTPRIVTWRGKSCRTMASMSYIEILVKNFTAKKRRSEGTRRNSILIFPSRPFAASLLRGNVFQGRCRSTFTSLNSSRFSVVISPSGLTSVRRSSHSLSFLLWAYQLPVCFCWN